jgi:hypothetical protein
MPERLTKSELEALVELLEHARERGLLAPSLAGWWWALQHKLRLIADQTVVLDADRLAFALTLPLRVTSAKGSGTVSLAPTLNEYATLHRTPWLLKGLRSRLDGEIRRAIARWPDAMARGRRRAVVFTRRSSRRPDEISVDGCGGKVPIDRLVRAGVLAGDAGKRLVRDARWEPADPGDGEFVVEVFDVGAAP